MTQINRRIFMASGLSLTLATPALARKDWVLPEEFLPTQIRLRTKLPEGEIHVDPGSYRLYFTQEKRQAVRFVVGIGRREQYERGTFTVGAKKEWPSWRPTDEMIERDPGAYKKFEDGMPGGPKNPLGARALYLFDDKGRDTFLRIHGTPQPWTINSAVSNGCVRLTNDHVALLYDMVPIGTKVVLH